MSFNRSFLACFVSLILLSSAGRSQYTHETITLRSDFPSKSVLVTNTAEDRLGDISPVLIAASWAENGKQLECRSLIQFNYVPLPKMLHTDPFMISSAQLILYPVNTLLSADDINKPARFVVRRVTEPWIDSTTIWINQPAVDSFMVSKQVKIKQKNNPVSVDVTKLVIDMLRFGNKGFMIGPEIMPEVSLASGELFASPKNENKELRPLLVINYSYLGGPNGEPRTMDPTIRTMRPQTPTGGTDQLPVRTTSTPVNN